MKSAVNEYFFSLAALFLLFFNSKKPSDLSDGFSDIPSKPHTLNIYTSYHTFFPNTTIFCKTFVLHFRSSPRPISNSQLHTLLHFHLCPIYLIVSQGSYFLMDGISHLGGGFTLRCLQRLSLPDLATLPCRWSTTDTPVVRPARSSRTKASSSQISYARAG